MTIKKRIDWISILQGWSILLVVIGHVNLTDIFLDPQTPVVTYITKVIYQFHMALFMFIAGFLLYKTKLAKNISYITMIREKVVKLLIPYFILTSGTFLLKYIAGSFMKRKVEFTFDSIFNAYFMGWQNPLKELWFIPTIFLLFLLYPLYKQFIKNIYFSILFTIASVLLTIYTFDIPFFYISTALIYLLYFYIGIIGAKYEITQYLNSWYVFAGISSIFILINALFPIFPPIILAFIGIIFSISFCLNVAKLKPNLFSSFRDYSYQIYLLGFFFQMALKYVYKKYDSEFIYISLSIVSVYLGLYLPVIISKIVKSFKNRYLTLSLGL